jgi:GH24 family phage-related lysozyme (muramidase)
LFSKKVLKLPQGKTVLLNSNITENKNLFWKSDDENVAVVDKNGFVYGKNQGETIITEINLHNNTSSKREVCVTKFEPIKFLYSTPNNALVNSNILICATTNKNIKNVQFKIDGENYFSTIFAENPIAEKETLVWTHNFKIDKPGNYKITAYGLTNDGWETCFAGFTELTVDAAKKNELNSIKKNLSEEGINFITSCEGLKKNYYIDVAGIPTLGYGQRIYYEQNFYNNLTNGEAIALFLKNGAKYKEDFINKFLINNKILFNQNHFDALVSFCYNLGVNVIAQNNSYLRKILLNCGISKKLIGVVNSENGLCFRNNCNFNGKKIKALPNKTQVFILDPIKHNQNWYYSELSSGEKGYCCADFLEIKTICEEGNLNFIDKENFIKEFSMHHHVNKKCCGALISRRFQELDMFFFGKYSTFKNLTTYLKKNNRYNLPKCFQKN